MIYIKERAVAERVCCTAQNALAQAVSNGFRNLFRHVSNFGEPCGIPSTAASPNAIPAWTVSTSCAAARREYRFVCPDDVADQVRPDAAKRRRSKVRMNLLRLRRVWATEGLPPPSYLIDLATVARIVMV